MPSSPFISLILACMSVAPGSARLLFPSMAERETAQNGGGGGGGGGGKDVKIGEFCLYRVVVLRKYADTVRSTTCYAPMQFRVTMMQLREHDCHDDSAI
jgi:hypothetical protein